MTLRDVLHEWICSFIGHKWDHGGYFLEYVKPTKKLPFGYYHDLEICARCSVTRLVTGSLTFNMFKDETELAANG